MGIHVVRLTDLGEGIVEAEIVEWFVEVGDPITSESVLLSVMTDKAVIEVAAPIDGTISWLGPQPGDTISVGSELAGIDLNGDAPETPTQPAAVPDPSEPPPPIEEKPATPSSPNNSGAGRPLAQPSVRKRARDLGIDLGAVPPTGRGGRVTHEDVDHHLTAGAGHPPAVLDESVTEHPVRGVRRAIADKMTTSWQRIPHITYVEEIDVTELETLRAGLNERHADSAIRLTLLPFILRGLVIACADRPTFNATFDDTEGVVRQSAAVHAGVATQTSNGLVVPVVRHVETLDLWELAAKMRELADGAREGRLGRDELTGSTITVSSLGALGGVVTTPIINHPEVAVIGVNKIQTRPVWQDGSFVPRKMMNLSSSFDHRIIDGWDAAEFVQHLKRLLESPALLFINEPR